MATQQTTKATAKPAAVKDAPKVDPLAGISVSVEDAPLPSITRNRDVVNPFLDAVSQSHADGKPRGVTVPEDAVSRAVYLMRQAADRQNLGIRIVKDEPQNGSVRIRFQGKNKRRVTRKDKSAAAA